MKHNIILTGSSGTIGSFLLSNSLKDAKLFKLSYKDCYDPKNISKKISSKKFEYLIHCAAPLDLDKGELYQDDHYRDLFLVTKNIVDYCRENKIKIIYMSSTGVYGNWKSSHYSESDKCIPTSFHHICKHKAEKYIKNNLSDYYILRLGWIFSSKFSSKNHDFISKILNVLKKNKNLTTNMIQKGIPTPTFLVDKVVQFIIKNPNLSSTTLNVVSSGSAYRMEYISAIQDFFGTQSVIKGSKNFKRKAKVSNNETATNEKLSKLIQENILHWKEYIFNIEK